MSAGQVSFQITEDGEAVGTLRQFASRFRLTPASVLDCLRHRAPSDVVLDAGSGRDRLLILTASGIDAICSCASTSPSPC